MRRARLVEDGTASKTKTTDTQEQPKPRATADEEVELELPPTAARDARRARKGTVEKKARLMAWRQTLPEAAPTRAEVEWEATPRMGGDGDEGGARGEKRSGARHEARSPLRTSTDWQLD